jgi:hypothetical protein
MMQVTTTKSRSQINLYNMIMSTITFYKNQMIIQNQ